MTRSRTDTLLSLARAAGLFAALRRWHRRELLVLTYHSVVDVAPERMARHAPLYRNAVTAAHFEEQLRHLKRRYRVLGGAGLRAFLDGRAFARPPALITFDDGLLNNATVAWPLLKKHALPAFFFLPTAFLDAASRGEQRLHWTEEVTARLLLAPARGRTARLASALPGLSFQKERAATDVPFKEVLSHLKLFSHRERTEHLARLRGAFDAPLHPERFPADCHGRSLLATMTWRHARAMMAEGGATFGSHTARHRILTRLPPEEAQREITASKARIEDALNRPCRFFAYPNGTRRDFSAIHRQMLRGAGYRTAFTQVRGFNRPGARPMALRRLGVSPDYPPSTFRYVASGAKLLVDRHLRRRR